MSFRWLADQGILPQSKRLNHRSACPLCFSPMKRNNWIGRNALEKWIVALSGVVLAGGLEAANIATVLKSLDPASSKVTDSDTTHEINGIVSARATLQDGSVLAYVQAPGEAAVPVHFAKADAAKVVVRNELSLSGKLGTGPMGFGALIAREGAVTVNATNRAFGASEPRGASFFKDALPLANKYVQLTNVSFVAPRFDGSGKAVVRGDSGEVTLVLPRTLRDRDVPPGQVNVFGIPLKVSGEWQLMASRFLSANNKASIALASKHTCMNCHNPDIKAVGPALRDVAARYKDVPDARAILMVQVMNGGSGKWGTVPMPALGAKIPPAERDLLIDWVYGYRWDAILSE